MASASVVAAPVSANKLSSSAAFGASATQFAPVRNVTVTDNRIVAVTADLSEENTPVTKKVLTSVLAAGLAISIAGSSFAASGPGGAGAERTARKADELLKGADSLIKNDSPQRFGPERGFGNATDKSDEDRFSRKAGSGAIPEVQDTTSAQVSGARDKFASNVDKTKRRIDGIWGQGKGLANDAVATVQGKADDAAKGGKNLFGQGMKKNMLGQSIKNKADEVTAPATNTGGGGFFGKIKQQSRGVQGAIAKKGNELQSKLPK